jgi:hypothetical protein
VSREAIAEFLMALTEDRGVASKSELTEARVRRADAVLRATGW